MEAKTTKQYAEQWGIDLIDAQAFIRVLIAVGIAKKTGEYRPKTGKPSALYSIPRLLTMSTSGKLEFEEVVK